MVDNDDFSCGFNEIKRLQMRNQKNTHFQQTITITKIESISKTNDFAIWLGNYGTSVRTMRWICNLTNYPYHARADVVTVLSKKHTQNLNIS